ncbi:MAG TPA: disulfide bond formation protein B [Steroidobacteraceae bacterium]|nr:disulfide bond formation protein B [Steroidobacteraceae bacterium]
MQKYLSPRIANAAGFLACCGLIGYALYAQYVLFLEPCPLCLFQRFAVMAMGVVFLLAALHNPQRGGAKVYAILAVVVALGGIAISARHIWIQSQPPGSVAACGASLGYLFDIMSFADVLQKVFTGSGECAKIDWQLLGLSMPWWTAFSMTGLGLWGFVTNWPKR